MRYALEGHTGFGGTVSESARSARQHKARGVSPREQGTGITKPAERATDPGDNAPGFMLSSAPRAGGKRAPWANHDLVTFPFACPFPLPLPFPLLLIERTPFDASFSSSLR